jgi:hypothetical protein
MMVNLNIEQLQGHGSCVMSSCLNHVVGMSLKMPSFLSPKTTRKNKRTYEIHNIDDMQFQAFQFLYTTMSHFESSLTGLAHPILTVRV